MSDSSVAPRRVPLVMRGACVTRGPMRNLIAVTLMLGAVAGCGRFGGAPQSEEDKTLYGLGMIIGKNLQDFNLTPRELDIVKAGMTDTVQKKKTALAVETAAPHGSTLHW